MKFSVFSVVLGLIALFYFLGFVFMPVQFMSQYGIRLDEGGASIGRLFGGALGGYAIAFWIIRNQAASTIAVRSALWATVFSNLVYLFVSLHSLFNGLVNSLAWSSVVVNILIILASLYYLLQKKIG